MSLLRRYDFSSVRTPAWAYGPFWQLGSHVALTRVRRFFDSTPLDTGDKGQTLLKGPSMCLFYVRLSSREEGFEWKRSMLNVSVGPQVLTGQTNDYRRWLTSRPPRNVISGLQMFPLWQSVWILFYDIRSLKRCCDCNRLFGSALISDRCCTWKLQDVNAISRAFTRPSLHREYFKTVIHRSQGKTRVRES